MYKTKSSHADFNFYYLSDINFRCKHRSESPQVTSSNATNLMYRFRESVHRIIKRSDPRTSTMASATLSNRDLLALEMVETADNPSLLYKIIKQKMGKKFTSDLNDQLKKNKNTSSSDNHLSS